MDDRYLKKLELSDAFIVGVSDIDEYHQYLVSLINDTVDAWLEGDLDQCRVRWDLFCLKLSEHFIEEEEIMRGYGYEVSKHNQAHVDILEKTKTICTDNKTLEEWKMCIYGGINDLVEDILKHDLHFAAFLKDYVKPRHKSPDKAK